MNTICKNSSQEGDKQKRENSKGRHFQHMAVGVEHDNNLKDNCDNGDFGKARSSIDSEQEIDHNNPDSKFDLAMNLQTSLDEDSDHNHLNCGGDADDQASINENCDDEDDDDDSGVEKSRFASGKKKENNNLEGKFDLGVTPATSLGEDNNNHNYFGCGGDHDQENPDIDSEEEQDDNNPDSKLDLGMTPPPGWARTTATTTNSAAAATTTTRQH